MILMMTTTMIRRIEVANLNIAMTGTGKIVFSCKTTPGLHYTVNLGGKSGVFGFHKTTEGPNRGYETLGAARPEDLIAALEPITNQLVPELLAAVRPRRLGFIITILESSPDCFQTSTALRLERREAHCSCGIENKRNRRRMFKSADWPRIEQITFGGPSSMR